MRPSFVSRARPAPRTFVAAAVSAVAIFLFVATAAGSLTERGFGLTTAPAASCMLVVRSNGGSQSGLNPGDAIDTRRLDPHKRLHLMVTGGGDRMEVPAMVGGRERMVMLAPMAAQSPSPAAYARVGALLALLAFGLFALWRGRDNASLGLGVFFAAMPSLFLHHAYPGLPDAAIVAVLFLSAIVAALAYLGLYGMIETLAARSPARRYFGLARAIVLAALGIVATTSIVSISSQLLSGCAPLEALRVTFVCYAVVIAVGCAVLWTGMQRSAPADRRRLGWIFWSTLVGYSGPLVTYALVALGRPIPFDGLYNVCFLAIPIGYSYAVLRHRVIDVGFVLNRALAYTLLTTIVVSAFILTESFAEGAALGNTESLLLKIAIPLGFGLGFNALHKRVERTIEIVFFRARRAAEEALQAFAHEADHFENAPALMQRTVEEMLQWARAGGAALYVRDGRRFARAAEAGAVSWPPALDPDDRALVALRATATYAGLDRRRSELGLTGYVFPFLIGGRLEGLLAVRPQDDGEAFSGEELRSIDHVAKRVAAGLAGLRLAEYERASALSLQSP